MGGRNPQRAGLAQHLSHRQPGGTGRDSGASDRPGFLTAARAGEAEPQPSAVSLGDATGQAVPETKRSPTASSWPSPELGQGPKAAWALLCHALLRGVKEETIKGLKPPAASPRAVKHSEVTVPAQIPGVIGTLQLPPAVNRLALICLLLTWRLVLGFFSSSPSSSLKERWV